MKKVLALCFLLSHLMIFAQEIPTCGSDAVNKQLLKDPKIASKMAEYEKAVQSRKLKLKAGKSEGTIYRIPVVVHVMHKGEAVGVGTNLSDDVIKAKMKAINEQYRKIPGSTGDGAGVDMEIEFVLAVRNPQGNPTNGIDRYKMTNQAYLNYGVDWSTTDQYAGLNVNTMKALAFWDSKKYYNIWIVSEVDNNNGGSGIQGAAQPATAHGTAADGFFITANSFKDPLGRMETHELGHAFNLYHTFQGDNPSGNNSTFVCPSDDQAVTSNPNTDYCADTPPHKRATSGDCSVTTNSCPVSNPSDVSYLHNYMNYTLDGCRNMFTADQKNRAITAMTTLRASFLSTDSTINLVPVAAPVAGFLPTQPVVITTGSDLELSDASTNVPSNYLNYYNWPGMTFNWNVTDGTQTLTSTEQNPVLNFASEGIYSVYHDVNNGLGTASIKGNQIIYVVAPAAALPNTVTSTNSGNYTINYVKLNDIEKTIIPNTNVPYVDYTNTDMTALIPGKTYPLTFNAKAGTPYKQWSAIYIDWNGNGIFEEGNNEKQGAVDIAAGTAAPRTVDVIVPTTAVKNKLVRMRVASNASNASSNNPTAAISNAMVNGTAPFYIGDVKDFGIYVVDQAPTLGMEDYILTDVNFYPNPVKDIFHISNTETIEKVEIYNMMGQLVLSENFQNTKVEMNLSHLQPGTYIATVYANGKKGSVKVLKK